MSAQLSETPEFLEPASIGVPEPGPGLLHLVLGDCAPALQTYVEQMPFGLCLEPLFDTLLGFCSLSTPGGGGG